MTAKLTAKRCRCCGWICIEVVMPLECPICRAAGCNKGRLETIDGQGEIKAYLMWDYIEEKVPKSVIELVDIYAV